MKKFLWCLLIIVAVAAIAYFVAYPLLFRYAEENHPDVLEKLGIAAEEKKEEEVPLMQYGENNAQIEIKEGWVEPEKIVYNPRAVPSVEKDFYALNFPAFQYVQEGNGELNRDMERSYRTEDGVIIYLVYDEKNYIASASLEMEVPKEKFNSTSMNEHIGLYLDFIRVITDREVSSDDKAALLRAFTNMFNDPESKNNTIKINGLSFRIVLDTQAKLIKIEC